MINNQFETLYEVRLNDSSVANALSHELPLERVIVILANEKRELVNEYLKLEAIAPRKYRLPDGKLVIWHCPDELVPIRNLGQ